MDTEGRMRAEEERNPYNLSHDEIVNDETTNCPLCDEEYHNDDMMRDLNGNYICPDCLESQNEEEEEID